jgi:hypothetical protein
MSGAGRLTRTVLVVVFGGVTVAWLAYLFALFGCSWEGCSTRDHVTFYVLLAAGAVGIGAAVRVIWRRPRSGHGE